MSSRSKRTSHKDKHLKKLRELLLMWRREFQKEFKDVEQHLHTTDKFEQVTEQIDTDLDTIKHIEWCISALNVYFDKESTLEDIDRPTIRELAKTEIDGTIHYHEKGKPPVFEATFEVEP